MPESSGAKQSNKEGARGPIYSLGRATLDSLREAGRLALLFFLGLERMLTPPWRFRRILQHIHFIGLKSSFIVGLTGLFTGMVLGLQLYYTLSKVGSTAFLGPSVALSLIRELGPVLTALMITGRAGSSIAAELGVMRISEQIDALDTMNIDPLRYLVGPRFAAALVCFPLLTALFNCIGIFGGYVSSVLLLGMNPGTYFSYMQLYVEMQDINGGFLKSVVFSLIVVTVCCHKGFNVHLRRDGHGASGVGAATTSAVVLSSVLILVFDYVLTSFLL